MRRISAAFALLMQRLGYQRYGAAGGDWGAIIGTDLARGGDGRVRALPHDAARRAAGRGP